MARRIAAIELEGRITALDTATQTFVLRGQTVSYANNPRCVVGSAADLAVNRQLNVKGRLSADRNRVDATVIHLER